MKAQGECPVGCGCAGDHSRLRSETQFRTTFFAKLSYKKAARKRKEKEGMYELAEMVI